MMFQMPEAMEGNMNAFQYVITVESDTPPQILLGQELGGAIVTKLEKAKKELVSAAQLAAIYSLSVNTIRFRLITINQGTGGKFLYNPEAAHQLLTAKELKRGRKRIN